MASRWHTIEDLTGLARILGKGSRTTYPLPMREFLQKTKSVLARVAGQTASSNRFGSPTTRPFTSLSIFTSPRIDPVWKRNPKVPHMTRLLVAGVVGCGGRERQECRRSESPDSDYLSC